MGVWVGGASGQVGRAVNGGSAHLAVAAFAPREEGSVLGHGGRVAEACGRAGREADDNIQSDPIRSDLICRSLGD